MTAVQGIAAVALVAFAALMGLAFYHGRRRNRAIVLRVAREIESVLEPRDRTYTWIGGLIGFHARFEVEGLAWARATCTLLPRHAPLYMPLALALGRGDRAYVTLALDGGIEAEAHIVDAALMRSPLFEIDGREAMHEAPGMASGRRFLLMAAEPRLLGEMEVLLAAIDRMGLAGSVRHLAFVPALSTLHAQVIPREGVVEAVTGLLLGRANAAMRGRVVPVAGAPEAPAQ